MLKLIQKDHHPSQSLLEGWFLYHCKAIRTYRNQSLRFP
nr:MAG TPA_asm: hypothetical protein [Caudoviricetes sp.]